MSVERALRLVKGGPERRAIDAGEVDAVIDSATGNVFLLPQAKRAVALAGGEAANRLLAALPRQDYLRMLPELEPVTLTCGEVLHQPGERIRQVWFPGVAHVSLLMPAEDKALEVGLVGRDGMVGIAVALGAEFSPVRAVVQGAGSALRMSAASLREALAQSAALQRELCRYAYAKLIEARQTAACNRFHSVEERLARWLLMSHDCARADRLYLTHELLADTLGVRRVGVTNAASALQRRNLIDYRRGNIRILDRKGLEAAACRCYRTVRELSG